MNVIYTSLRRFRIRRDLFMAVQLQNTRSQCQSNDLLISIPNAWIKQIEVHHLSSWRESITLIGMEIN